MGTVNPYEIMLMLDPELADERQIEIVSRARELVEKSGGVWHAHEPWGRRKLAYEIAKKAEASYHLLYFDCDAATLDELTRILRITEGSMRQMAVRRTTPLRPRQTAPAAPPAESVHAGE